MICKQDARGQHKLAHDINRMDVLQQLPLQCVNESKAPLARIYLPQKRMIHTAGFVLEWCE